ncbi:potassium channel family protein [Motilibacter rhizosphaerae]|uniref:potassium channel family protein n=1 Tax=Motilibacter rhizosphaerae TaxID=598652 RepID=UPI00102C9702|nr:potassium channel family protein [Motilibacter rhizosphaerae]
MLKSTQAIVAAPLTLVVIAALAMLDAERRAPGSHIRTLADAVWWASTIVTTVGYGDTYPVTGTGRVVAAALMLVGIALAGLVTGTVAAWFVAQTRQAEERVEDQLLERLSALEVQPSALTIAVSASKHD